MATKGRDKAEQEIAEGKLGIARDRLHGLLVTFPRDLTVRSRLGDVYWALGYPIEAGRFWFLDFPQDDRKVEAVDAFTDSCKGDPSLILRRLKLRCSLEDLGADAQARVLAQIEGCRARGLDVPDLPLPVATPNPSRWPAIGCMLFGVVIAILVGIGAYACFQWLKDWVDLMERRG